MASAQTALVVTVAAVLALAFVPLTYCQTVVDKSQCEAAHVECPGNHPSYKKYCCIESDGGSQLYYCCNPYFGLYIGVGVGVPVVVIVVILVVVAYCCCVRYQNRKMRALIAAYNARRRRADQTGQGQESEFVAPPPYTPLLEDSDNKDSELPPYTESDPYSQTTQEQGEGGEAGQSADREQSVAQVELREVVEITTEGHREEDSVESGSQHGVEDDTPLIAGTQVDDPRS